MQGAAVGAERTGSWHKAGSSRDAPRSEPRGVSGPEQEQRVVQAERVACRAPQTARCPRRCHAGASWEAAKVAGGLGGCVNTGLYSAVEEEEVDA